MTGPGELHVPDVTEDDDVLSAAIKYAAAGWYLVPIKRGTKNPGSVVGDHWQHKSSRDPQMIAAWFAGTDHGIALHCGRSGAVVFDVDNPDKVPAELGSHLGQAPYQATRDGQPWRGHYLFLQPADRMLGNSTGKLGGAWGEVRGTSGVIVVAPTEHPDEGGRYAWERTGTVPPLPKELSALLPDGHKAEAVATDAQVIAFLDAHTGSDQPVLFKATMARWRREYEAGASRHMTALGCLVWSMREAKAGLYPARMAHDELANAFLEAAGRRRQHRVDGKVDLVRSVGDAVDEWQGIAAWAIGQAVASDDASVRALADAELKKRADQDAWLTFVAPDLAPSEDGSSAPGEDEAAAATEEEIEGAAAARIEAEAAFNRQVAEEMFKLRVRDTARRRLRSEGATAYPKAKRLDVLLAEPDPAVTYRITGLWPSGGRVLLAAAFKAGKSTLMANTLRCLVDGGDLLGHWPTEPVARNVVLVDNELDEHTTRRWLRDQGVENTDHVHVINLRGAVSTFDLTDPDVRQHWASELIALEADVVILDCLRPVLDAIGLDEHKEAGRFLTAFDELLGMAGAREAIVVHHAGHEGERARGDSRLRDWPDVEWRIVREKSEETGDAIDPSAKRYFAAYGRDVSVKEGAISYDEETRRLTYDGGSRSEARAEGALPVVIEALQENPEGLSGRAVEEFATNAGQQRNQARKALQAAVRRGLVRVRSGPRNSTLHFLVSPEEALRAQDEALATANGSSHESSAPVRRSAPGALAHSVPRQAEDADEQTGIDFSAPVRRSAPGELAHSSSECASAPIGRRTALTAAEEDQKPVRHRRTEPAANDVLEVPEGLVDPQTGELIENPREPHREGGDAA